MIRIDPAIRYPKTPTNTRRLDSSMGLLNSAVPDSWAVGGEISILSLGSSQRILLVQASEASGKA